MAVPTTGQYEMFGTSSASSIEGAISASGVDTSGVTTFHQLINLSTVEYFDPVYAGNISALSDVSASLQYRNYPVIPNTATPTPSPTATDTPTPTPTFTNTPTPTATDTPTPEPTDTPTPVPTDTPTPEPTDTPTPEPTDTPTPEPTDTPTPEPTDTPTPEPTDTPTPVPTDTPTPEPTDTPTPEPTDTPTPEPTDTPTPEPTDTPTPEPTDTPTPTPTDTPIPCTSISLGFATTTYGDACQDYFTGPSPHGIDTATFSTATLLYVDGDCSSLETNAGYYSNGTIWKYWDGTSFTTDGECGIYGPTPTPTITDTPSPTDTPTPEPTDTPTPEPTDTATPEPTDTPTPEPTDTPTPEPTDTPTPEPTDTPTPEPTDTPTPEPTDTPTPEPTDTPTPEPTDTPTPEPTDTPTPEPTDTPTPEPTDTPTPEPTDTPTPTPTPVLFYYQLTTCDGNTSNSIYGYSTTERTTGFTVSYLSNIYTYYDVDNTNSGEIDLDSLTLASCPTDTPTPEPTDTPTPEPTDTPTPEPTDTPTPTPTPTPVSLDLGYSVNSGQEACDNYNEGERYTYAIFGGTALNSVGIFKITSSGGNMPTTVGDTFWLSDGTRYREFELTASNTAEPTGLTAPLCTAPTATPTNTPEPTDTPTPEPTDTPTPEPTDTPSPTPTDTPEPTDTPTPTPTPTQIPTSNSGCFAGDPAITRYFTYTNVSPSVPVYEFMSIPTSSYTGAGCFNEGDYYTITVTDGTTSFTGTWELYKNDNSMQQGRATSIRPTSIFDCTTGGSNVLSNAGTQSGGQRWKLSTIDANGVDHSNSMSMLSEDLSMGVANPNWSGNQQTVTFGSCPPTPTPTNTPEPTDTPTPTPEPTDTPTPEPTDTPTPEPTDTPTPEPTDTPTPEPTDTPTPEPTDTPTPEPTDTPTPEPTDTPTPEPTDTPTPEPTDTPTPEPTDTPTPEPTDTPTPEPTDTPTPEPTDTPTPEPTDTPTPEPTDTPTPTPTPIPYYYILEDCTLGEGESLAIKVVSHGNEYVVGDTFKATFGTAEFRATCWHIVDTDADETGTYDLANFDSFIDCDTCVYPNGTPTPTPTPTETPVPTDTPTPEPTDTPTPEPTDTPTPTPTSTPIATCTEYTITNNAYDDTVYKYRICADGCDDGGIVGGINIPYGDSVTVCVCAGHEPFWFSGAGPLGVTVTAGSSCNYGGEEYVAPTSTPTPAPTSTPTPTPTQEEVNGGGGGPPPPGGPPEE